MKQKIAMPRHKQTNWNNLLSQNKTVVIVTEKPSVAYEISLALKDQLGGSGSSKKSSHCYILKENFVITWVFGHLLELYEPKDYNADKWGKWNLSSMPIIPSENLEDYHLKIKEKNDKSAKDQLQFVLKSLKQSDFIIAATDAGREGELIFRNLLEYCKLKNINNIFRLWISSLTKESILEGFSHLYPLEDFNPLYMCAKSRSVADWLVGINATRILTLKFNATQTLWSVGRVQTPTLALIANRDEVRKNFVVENYLELRANYEDATHAIVVFKHPSQFKGEGVKNAKSVLELVENLPLEIVGVENKIEKIYPPKPFDLNQLQQNIFSLLSLSAQSTLDIAQFLYEKKLITYPRTDSQFLTKDIRSTVPGILDKLKIYNPTLIDNMKISVQDKRVDYIFKDNLQTDHHAIIPTGIIPAHLNTNQKIVYEAILRRFVAIFYPPAQKSITKILGKVVANKTFDFLAFGSSLLEQGFLELYPKKLEKPEYIPNFKVGEKLNCKYYLKDLQTSPPPALNDGSLLKMMENADKEKGLGKLGTSATRANIIETLITRKYVERREKNLCCTELGFTLLSMISIEELKTPELTGQWEEILETIEQKKDLALGKEFLKNLIEQVKTYPEKLTFSSTLGYLGPCPDKEKKCVGKIIRGNTSFGCSMWKNNCAVRFPFEMEGIKITDEMMQQILLFGKVVAKFPSLSIVLKNNQLVLEENESIKRMIPKADSIGECYLCKAPLEENNKAYFCPNWRNGCPFTFWKKMASKTIPRTQIRKFLKSGETDFIEGFLNAKKNKFKAKISWIEAEKKIGFTF